MASLYDVHATHAVAYPANVLAQKAGHIQSVTCSADLDNGSVVALGDFIDLDLYEDDGTVIGFEAEIVKKAPNGNWYARIKSAGNAYIVYTEPVTPEEYNNKFKSEKRFFNAAGAEARVYQSFNDDVWEFSAEAFTGTPAVGATITTITNHKMVIG